MNQEKKNLEIWMRALQKWQEGFADLPQIHDSQDDTAIEKILLTVAEKLHADLPYFHPNYAGQMIKTPHTIARLAYMLALYLNPNNHALDAGRASSQMEKEAVAALASMFGWKEHLGHLTSGGTMANLEALWVAGKLGEGKLIVASDQAHYTHARISEVLRLPFESIPTTPNSRMDLAALEKVLSRGNVGTVVVTIGTTGTGALDPLPEILQLQKKYGFRIHADAAYGGYFVLVDNVSNDAKKVFASLEKVDSLVVDPHKHGLQPYGCGCVLFRDPGVGKFYKHDSPYTYFTSEDLHLGEISLECSRPGACAIALWATQQLLPMTRGGGFAQGLEKSRRAALGWYEKIREESRFIPLLEPELDIVVWAVRAEKTSEISRSCKQLFRKAAENHLHLALFQYPTKLLPPAWDRVLRDEPYVTCLRSCLMKPEHEDSLDDLWAILQKSFKDIVS